MLDKKIFAKGMAILSAVYPERECNESTTAAYWEFLKTFDTQDFEKVIKNHISQSKYFPKVCELKEELVRLRGFHRPTAAQAWENLIKDAEAGKDEFEGDEATSRALMAVGGWRTFSFTPFKDLAFRFRDFERTYNEALAQDDRQMKLEGANGRAQIGEQKKIER